jgi:hypothetical protein
LSWLKKWFVGWPKGFVCRGQKRWFVGWPKGFVCRGQKSGLSVLGSEIKAYGPFSPVYDDQRQPCG